MGRKTEPLSGVDAAWLGMEDPTNLMMVTGIMTFAKPMDFDRLREVVERRWLKFDRFRQRVVQPQTPWNTKAWFPPYWEIDSNFDLDQHLTRIQVPPPGDREALRELVSRWMSTPLDFSRPLWHMHLIEGVGEGSVLLTRIHHCIADGMALTQVLLSIADQTADAPRPEPWEPEEEEETDEDGLRGGLFEALVKQAASVAGTVTRMTGKVVHESLETLGNPAHLVDLAKYGAENAVALQRLFLRPDDPPTIFRGKLGVSKRAAWSRPLNLAEVKAVKMFTGGTVNDVLITAMAGGLRRYMVERNALPKGLSFRAAVPVDLRKPKERGEMGNKFGLVFLSLPVGIEDAQERLQVVRRRMDALKSSREAPVLFGLMSAAGMLAHEIQKILVEMLGSKGTAVMTNMMGPRIPLYLAGQQIEHQMFWVPQSGRMGLGISILSYNGKVYLGVATDAGLVPDPERIVEGFNQEFKGLLEAARAAAGKPAAEPAKAERPVEKTAASAAMETSGPATPRRPLARKPLARKPSLGKPAAAPPPEAPQAAAQTSESGAERKPFARKVVAKKAGTPRAKSEGAAETPTTATVAADKPSQTARCQATTKSGKQCRNTPLADSPFCAVHKKRGS